MTQSDLVPIDENLVARLVRNGVVSDTFRRLTPDKKSRLYRVALALFAEYGHDGLSIDHYCQEAGISKGSFFQYFPSKSHLLEFVVLIFDDYVELLSEEIRQHDPGGTARQRLLYLYQALVVNSRLHQTEQRFYLFLTHAVHHSQVALEGLDIERHLHAYVQEIIQQGETSGEIRRDFDIQLTGYIVSAIISALLAHQFSGRPAPRQQIDDLMISLLFDGIRG
jgi:AcrR family transcriptional regulator